MIVLRKETFWVSADDFFSLSFFLAFARLLSCSVLVSFYQIPFSVGALKIRWPAFREVEFRLIITPGASDSDANNSVWAFSRNEATREWQATSWLNHYVIGGWASIRGPFVPRMCRILSLILGSKSRWKRSEIYQTIAVRHDDYEWENLHYIDVTGNLQNVARALFTF